jgi:hypothetical protein
MIQPRRQTSVKAADNSPDSICLHKHFIAAISGQVITTLR